MHRKPFRSRVKYLNILHREAESAPLEMDQMPPLPERQGTWTTSETERPSPSSPLASLSTKELVDGMSPGHSQPAADVRSHAADSADTSPLDENEAQLQEQGDELGELPNIDWDKERDREGSPEAVEGQGGGREVVPRCASLGKGASMRRAISSHQEEIAEVLSALLQESQVER